MDSSGLLGKLADVHEIEQVQCLLESRIGIHAVTHALILAYFIYLYAVLY